MSMQSILSEILKHKRKELVQIKKRFPLQEPTQKLSSPESKSKDFLSSYKKEELFLIAEIKRASPSKGWIYEDCNPVEIAKIYEKSGVNAISVLTDEKYFKGSIRDLESLSTSSSLPLLRKDFIVDSYQILEAYYAGASAILLIVSFLKDSELQSFFSLASRLHLSVLLEVHTVDEFKRALEVPSKLIGMNHRSLQSFETDLSVSEKILSSVPKSVWEDRILIAESGIHSVDDLRYLRSLGISAVLIGETFMGQRSPERIQMKIKELLKYEEENHVQKRFA